MDPRQRLIVALDVSTAAAARKIVAAVGDSAHAYKVGMQLYTAEGPSIVRELVCSGRRVFLDLKYHDIPNTVAAAGGVHGQHAHAQLGRLPDGGCNGVRDVVILEIEKDAAAGTDQFADYGRTFGSVELHADLISMVVVANSRHDLPGGCGRRYIQGNDETLARVHILLGLDSRAMLSNYRC